jgi:hypothetical protein
MPNGILFPALFQGQEDNIRKVLYGSWLIRDWNYDNTSLTGFSPFASDGNLSSTLFSANNPGGAWYDLGYMDEKGPEFTPKVTMKPTTVMQSRWPARYDYTEQSEEIAATIMESNPVIDALYNNQALSSLQSVGTVGYSSAAPVELDLRWRQCLFIGVDGKSGQNYYIARVYPKVLIGDFGKTSWNINDAASVPIKGMAVPDPWSTPPDGVTVGSPRWILRDGPAGRAQGEANFQIAAPVATAVTGLKAIFADGKAPPGEQSTGVEALLKSFDIASTQYAEAGKGVSYSTQQYQQAQVKDNWDNYLETTANAYPYLKPVIQSVFMQALKAQEPNG